MKTSASRRKNSVIYSARIAALRILVALVAAYNAIAAVPALPAVQGRISAKDTDAPIPYTYIAISDSSFAIVGQTSSAADGTFAISPEKAVSRGYVIVQPPASDTPSGVGIYKHTPRIYTYDGEQTLSIKLPAAACIVLHAYDAQGQLMRWEDFRKRGTIGDQFMYMTDTNDCAMEATCWPVFDEDARTLGQPREKGLPALVVAPGNGYVPQMLFWETRGYGKLHLRADNVGAGFSVTQSKPEVIEVNIELAKTAARALANRFPAEAESIMEVLREAEGQSSAVDRAAAADVVLANALRLRDQLELARARDTIASRKPRTDFTFGAFEGSPYDKQAFQTARDAGFDLATVLLGWGWTDARGGAVDKSAIEQTFGIEKLRQQGFQLKAHGVVWLQNYGILPDRARAMKAPELRDAMLAQQQALLDAYGGEFAVWEAMNEPNVTNVVNAPREIVVDLLEKSARQTAARDNVQALVNSAHEGDYGRKFTVYTLDNNPADDWNKTYLSFLKDVDVQEGVSQLDAVGLQYYPGFHFNESFGGLQGPATTPSWLIDTIERYGVLHRPIHITEFSVPSSYQPGWTSGYWREPWTEQTQADYAEAVFTFAFADPNVHSITWWDITDKKPSVTTGGLCDANGNPKPALDQLRKLIASWKTK